MSVCAPQPEPLESLQSSVSQDLPCSNLNLSFEAQGRWDTLAGAPTGGGAGPHPSLGPERWTPATRTPTCVQAPPEVAAAYAAAMAEQQAGKGATADAGVAGDASASGLPDGLKVRGAEIRAWLSAVFDCCPTPSLLRAPPAGGVPWVGGRSRSRGATCRSVHAPCNSVCVAWGAAEPHVDGCWSPLSSKPAVAHPGG